MWAEIILKVSNLEKINKKSDSQDLYAEDFPSPLSSFRTFQKSFENILCMCIYIHTFFFSEQLKSWIAQLPFPNPFPLWGSCDRVWRAPKGEQKLAVCSCLEGDVMARAAVATLWYEEQVRTIVKMSALTLLSCWAKLWLVVVLFKPLELFFYYLQLKIFQSLTTGHGHCRYRRQ